MSGPPLDTPVRRLLRGALGAIRKAGLVRTGPFEIDRLPCVPRDGAIPHLAVALDPNAMRGIFEQTVFADDAAAEPGAGWQVRSCGIEWIRYRRGKSCTVAYRVRVAHRTTLHDSEQLLCVRVVGAGKSLKRFQALRVDALVHPDVGRAIAHLPELDMIVWMFPNDSQLHALASLLDEDRLRTELLPAVVEAAVGPKWTIRSVRRHVVQYVPEETCMVRVRARLERTGTSEHEAIVVYGKIAKGERGAETFRLMQRLWECEARTHGRLSVARPLLYDDRRHTLWQSGVPGAALLEQDLRGPRAHALLVNAAMAVAALHTAGVTCTRSVDVANAMSRLREMTSLVPEVVPSCRETLEAVVGRLLAQGERLGQQPVAVLHGDLRLRHFIFDGNSVSLIDVDGLCHGSPWQDIGSLAAAMLYKGMLLGTPRSIIQECLTTFCDQYARSVPWAMSKAEVGWYTAVALINERALRPITRLHPDQLGRVVELVELAARIPELEGSPWR